MIFKYKDRCFRIGRSTENISMFGVGGINKAIRVLELLKERKDILEGNKELRLKMACGDAFLYNNDFDNLRIYILEDNNLVEVYELVN